MKLIILFFLLTPFFLLAQTQGLSTKSKKAAEYYFDGQKEASRRNYPAALELFDKALKKDADFGEVHYLKAKTLLSIGEIEMAKYHFERASELLPLNSRYAETFMILGRMYMDEGDYVKAQQLFVKYIKADPSNYTRVELAKGFIRDCEFGKNGVKNPDSIQPKKLGSPINNFQYQYFPVLTGDGEFLFFTARNVRSTEEILVSRKMQGEWSPPQNISDNINTVEFNEGTCAISADGRTIVFTSCNAPGLSGRCDLLISYRQGNEWSRPKNLGRNINTPHWESQPSLSADGRLLLFSSDRPGGMGKMDIWYSVKGPDEAWKKAKNLGRPVNTGGEEFSPFLHSNNQTLFYSSGGRKGMGGLDLFVTTREKGKWSEPVNLGFPLNTWKDEVGIFVSSEGKTAFYSRTENEGGMERSFLYEVDLPKRLWVKNESYALKGKVFDSNNNKPLGAQINLMDLDRDTAIQSLRADSVNGTYLIILTKGANYGLFVSHPGYLYKSLNFELKNAGPNGDIILDIPLDPIVKGARTQLRNIFFDFGSYELRAESKVELKKLIAFIHKNPGLKIEIGGHTDDVGSQENNLALSKNRARAVKEFLVKNGIEFTNLTFKGYGETQPLFPNDSESNRQLNRRIEFKILEI
jgi:outer membrane protein OmpA-like peptidoglycan-associated protein/tetratricopeptide (TPR) repeat protein